MWHTLRYTLASRLTRSGVDLVTVKERLGINTTKPKADSDTSISNPGMILKRNKVSNAR